MYTFAGFVFYILHFDLIRKLVDAKENVIELHNRECQEDRV